jgi:hypothetical protein
MGRLWPCRLQDPLALAACLHKGDTGPSSPPSEEEWGVYRFTPLLVDTFGRLGKLMMSLLSEIGSLAVSRGDGLRELGVMTRQPCKNQR